MEINTFLVESALLTHGFSSISNDELVKKWKCTDKNIVWIDKGEIVIGDINEFCEFRKRFKELIRIDCFTLENALKDKLSGALTASGTMKVCENMGIKLAVTCGMGGIGDIKAGKHAEEIGEYYHPAANKKIDELTKGYSSWIQLDSLIDNVELAKKITDK